jgi:triacylglycerol lipase
MAMINRRQLLRAGLAASAFSIASRGSLLHSQSFAQNSDRQRSNQRTDRSNSLSRDRTYNHQTSELLVRCCDLAGEQYHRSKTDSSYDGEIRQLSEYRNYATLLDRYRQIDSFRLPQFSLAELFSLLSNPATVHSAMTQPAAVNKTGAKPGVEQSAISFDNVLWGYALTSDTDNIIALRGTQTEADMATGASALQVDFGAQAGKVHAGFYLVYQGLIGQLRDAVEKFDPSLPCYITGYSLGGAVAILAAAALAEGRLRNQLRVYTYATPRVGDPTFTRTYNALVPQTYRVVNQADLIPNLPPENFQGSTYAHVGEPWFYWSQCNNVERNHAIGTYRRAIDAGLESRQTQSQTTNVCT